MFSRDGQAVKRNGRWSFWVGRELEATGGNDGFLCEACAVPVYPERHRDALLLDWFLRFAGLDVLHQEVMNSLHEQ